MTKPIKISVPGSKSMTQRALIVAALMDGPVRIRGGLWCDDSKHLTTMLNQLGCKVTWLESEVQVQPSRLKSDGQVLFCGNGGTAMRFGSCLSLLCEGELVLDGDQRMRLRPIGPLGDALSKLGVEVSYLGKPGYPPWRLKKGTVIGERVEVDGSLSSQYASGLLMVGALMPRGLSIRVTGVPVSRPYLDMTIAMMRQAGSRVEWINEAEIQVKPKPYQADAVGPGLVVEPDWSAAAFVLAAAFLKNIEIHIPDLPEPTRSLQGDAIFTEYLKELQIERTHEFNINDTPDLIAPLVATCAFVSQSSFIRGAVHTRVKESDRIALLCREFGKIGLDIRERTDGMDIYPGPLSVPAPIELDPAEDHRMAMAFGITSLRLPAIRIKNQHCVSKSFPDFWKVLEAMRLQKC